MNLTKIDAIAIVVSFKMKMVISVKDSMIDSRTTKPIIIYLYVDDMLIFGTSLKVVCETKRFLKYNYNIKDIREV